MNSIKRAAGLTYPNGFDDLPSLHKRVLECIIIICSNNGFGISYTYHPGSILVSDDKGSIYGAKLASLEDLITLNNIIVYDNL